MDKFVFAATSSARRRVESTRTRHVRPGSPYRRSCASRLATIILAGLIGTAGANAPAFGQALTATGGTAAAKTDTAPTPDAKQTPTKLQTVIVTGTRASNRTAADSLSPIDILTPRELESTGAPDLGTALRTLLPSFNLPQPAITDASNAILPAQLRGLSPDETLVLIDGKRQHTTATINPNGSIGQGSSPVDLSAIPINAIERIEVLRSGAAAQYGSDAIAGVINIILKRGARHGAVSVSRGQYDGHQGNTWRGGANGGIALGRNGWVRLAVDYLHQDPTNHAGRDSRFPGDPTYGMVTFRYGLPGEIQRQAAINGQYRFGQHATLYGFSVFSKRAVSAAEVVRSVSEYRDSVPAAATTYPRGFRPLENSVSLDQTIVLGVRGKLAGWHYDLSGSTGGNHWKLHTSDTFNYSLGARSPTHFYIGTVSIRQDIFNADFKRTFDVGWYDPITVAWGLAWRHEQYQIKHGNAASWVGSGAQAFPGFQPEDAGSHARDNAAEYVDLETDLNSQLTLELAGRHEHYTDFGNTTVGKLSGYFAPTPAVALRATVATGFRAPSLQQEFYSSTADQLVNLGNGNSQFFVTRTFPVANPAAIALGAQSLKPEKSRNYGLGIVFTPSVGPYVTLDLYQIDIRDRIILSGDLVGLPVQQFLTSVGIPFVNGGRFFTNAVNTRTRGADLVATWSVPLRAARLAFTGGFNYNKTDIRSIRPNPAQLGLHGLVLPVINRPTRGRITVESPRTKAFVAAHWSAGHWSLRGRLTRYGRWQERGMTSLSDQTFGARYLLDASASYTAGQWTLTVGGDNVTNAYPEENNAYNDFHGNFPYPQLSPFGFNGVYYYATAAWRW